MGSDQGRPKGSSNEELQGAPALYWHCQRVYDAMASQSEPHPQATTLDGEPLQIYRGFLTKLFNELDISTPYYSHVMKRLKRMDCVRQLKRGGGGSESEWLLVQAPQLDVFNAVEDGMSVVGQSKQEAMAQQIRDLNARLKALEGGDA